MKKVVGQIKLQIPAGKATPAPPVGPALGQAGVNIMDFCKAFNARTAKEEGLIIPVVITVYADRSYTFITKTPPVAVLIKREAGMTLLKNMTTEALNKFRKSEGWKVGVDGSVALVDIGAGKTIDSQNIKDPVVGFVFGSKGLMYNLTLEGSKFTKLDKS